MHCTEMTVAYGICNWYVLYSPHLLSSEQVRSITCAPIELFSQGPLSWESLTFLSFGLVFCSLDLLYHLLPLGQPGHSLTAILPGLAPSSVHGQAM